MKNQKRPKVLIIGGGFAGLNAATRLKRAPVDITLLDRTNHHTFQPLLYQVATAGLSPAEIAAPIRSILKHQKNVEVLLGEVTDIDREKRRVLLKDGDEISYDYLIVAVGAKHSYFGHNEWETVAPGLKTLEDAVEIRRRVYLAFELAERHAAALGKSEPAMVHFVVIGGGPTGVELAGALAEISRKAIVKDFRTINPRTTRIMLLEGGPRVLPSYPEDLSASAEKQLHHLGVQVITNALVTDVEAGTIRVGDKQYPSTVTLWAAGVAGNELGRALDVPLDRNGRVIVNHDLTVPGHPEIFVVGDLAAHKDSKSGEPAPGVAPAAMQEGRHAAKNILRAIEGKPYEEFHYFDKGTMATIGRAAAIAQIRKIHLSGFVAWMMWLVVHLMFLIGFRNRVMVLIEWGWAYFTYQRAARLITGSTDLPGWEVSRDHAEPIQEKSIEEMSKAAD